MSDGEAFGWKVGAIALAIILFIIIITPQKNGECDTATILPEPVTITDTIYNTDTVYINKIKHDTVYITNKDTI